MTVHTLTYRETGAEFSNSTRLDNRKARDDSRGLKATGDKLDSDSFLVEAEGDRGAANQEFANLFSSLESLNSLLVTWEGQIDALWDIELWIYGRLNPPDVPIPGQPAGSESNC